MFLTFRGMFKKKINHTKFIFTKADPLTSATDAFVNWTVSSLHEGDELFIRLYKEGGSIINKEIAHWKTTSKVESATVCAVIITNSGILPFNKILHSVLPNYRVKEENVNKKAFLQKSIENIFTYMNLYNQNFETIRTITLTPIPSKVYGKYDSTTIPSFISLMIKLSLKENLREVHFVCNDGMYETYLKEFQYQSSSKWQRFLFSIGFKING